MRDLFQLPANLPVPQDDGACNHLAGFSIPHVSLSSTTDKLFDMAELSKRRTVFFFYPRTGRPEEPAPQGWDRIPGARGCTPQSCGFRNLYEEFRKLGFEVYGVSTQDSEYQKEFVQRNEIPFALLSDENFKLTNALKLPTFEFNSMRLIKRLAFVTANGVIRKFFYPIFPPNQNAAVALDWVKSAMKMV